jgi:sulfur carrier protein
MQVSINGENQTYDQELSILDLIEQSGLSGKRIAVEINESIVPRSKHADTFIAEGDKVEIIHAIGGG